MEIMQIITFYDSEFSSGIKAVELTTLHFRAFGGHKIELCRGVSFFVARQQSLQTTYPKSQVPY